MRTTSGGTSLGHVSGDLECLDGERVAVLTLLRPGSKIDGQPPPALRFFAVMSEGGEDQGDLVGHDDRDDRRDRDAPGKLSERCPGKPKPKRVSLKPAPSLVTLRPASQASRAPDDEVHYVEESSQDEEAGSSRRVVLVDEGGFSPDEVAGPARVVQTREGQPSGSAGPEVVEVKHEEGQLHGEALQPGDAEKAEKGEVQKQEGPKQKKYRRVRVKKKALQLEKDIQEMQSARRTRNERMACLRLLQQERRGRQGAAEPPGQQELPASKGPQETKKPEEANAEETKEPQPRTPSPSSVDWKAAEEETKRQFAEAKAAGRRILSYEEWDEEGKAKNERMPQEALRKSWLDREIALRALQQERGATREAVLRSTTTSAAGPLTDDEWVQMQEMMKRLPPAPEKPEKDEEQPQDKRAKTVQKDPKHGMQPPPPPPGYAGVWRGGCCPGFRWQGGQQGQPGPRGPQGQQGFWPGCGGQQQQVPPGGPQAFHPGLPGQAPAQQSMSLDLGPVRYRSPEELAEATAWLERQRGGPEMDLRTPGDVVRHDLAMAMAKSRAKAGVPTPPPARTVSPPQREVPAPSSEQQQGGGEGAGESLLQRILRLSGAGPICGGSPPSTPRAPSPSRTLSSTSEAEILETSEVEIQEVQYDESSRAQNEQMALRPKARPQLRRDPRHGGMAATGGDGGRDHRDGDDPHRHGSGSPEPEAEDNEEEDSVEETETQEFMYRMKRRSDELTGRKNKFQVGKSSAWEPQKLRKGRGHTVRWWPERRGKGSRGEESTITHSVDSPTTGWQRIYAKGKQPRALRVSNQGGKGSGGRIVLQGKGTNPAAELQLAQSLSRAAAAIRRAESAVATHGNGSEGAEAAYDEAAEAVNQFLDADAILHPPSGASSSSAAPSSSSAAPVGRGAANLGLEIYRDFIQNKGKGKTSRAHADAAADNEEGSDLEADPEDENYEEEIEEEEEHGDDGDYAEVELEVIPEEDHDGHGADGCAVEGPTTEDQEDAGCDDGGPEAHGLENNEEEERHEDDPNYNEEEEFVHEEHR